MYQKSHIANLLGRNYWRHWWKPERFQESGTSVVDAWEEASEVYRPEDAGMEDEDVED